MAVNCCVRLTRTEALDGLTVTLITTGPVIVTLADPETVGAAPLVAVTATVAGDGTLPGAVYIPSVSTIPTVGFPPDAPFTDHVTD